MSRKLTYAEVLALLAGHSYPLTTIEVAERCFEATGERRPVDGTPAREALIALERDGKLVSATMADHPMWNNRDRPPNNQWYFVARPRDKRAKWWMTPERAQAFLAELKRRSEVRAQAELAAKDIMTRLEAALPPPAGDVDRDPRDHSGRGVRVSLEMDDFTGAVKFELGGRGEDLTVLAAVLAAANVGTDAATAQA